MIVSFRDKALARFASTGDAKGLSVPNIKRLTMILNALDAARKPEDMNLPGLRFHALKGNRLGRFAVDASGNWRLTFGWKDMDAINLDLEDYH